jgi:DNA-directed RNA polymerase specialized sigma24 family protein
MGNRRLVQVIPFGRPFPMVIECVPNKMPRGRTAGFNTTHWSLVQAAAALPTADSREALAMLCQTYWRPVYGFIRRKGNDRDQSLDLTQGFFAVLIEKNYLIAADRERGKFRSFLLTAVKHFLAHEWEREHAQKRGGFHSLVSIDLVEAEAWYAPAAVTEETPERLFERQWALSLLARVLGKLREEFETEGKRDRFETLASFLDRDSDPARYKELAEPMGASPGALRMLVLRMRRRYRTLLREEIAQTVADPEEIDSEMRFLLTALRKQ